MRQKSECQQLKIANNEHALSNLFGKSLLCNKSQTTASRAIGSFPLVVLDSTWLWWRFEPRFTVGTGNMGVRQEEGRAF